MKIVQPSTCMYSCSLSFRSFHSGVCSETVSLLLQHFLSKRLLNGRLMYKLLHGAFIRQQHSRAPSGDNISVSSSLVSGVAFGSACGRDFTLCLIGRSFLGVVFRGRPDLFLLSNVPSALSLTIALCTAVSCLGVTQFISKVPFCVSFSM